MAGVLNRVHYKGTTVVVERNGNPVARIVPIKDAISEPESDVFSGRVASTRKQRMLSQAELAEISGLHPTAISHFEIGTRIPSIRNLKRLADSLEVSTDFLLGLTDAQGQ